jgi:hypothetical protein
LGVYVKVSGKSTHIESVSGVLVISCANNSEKEIMNSRENTIAIRKNFPDKPIPKEVHL